MGELSKNMQDTVMKDLHADFYRAIDLMQRLTIYDNLKHNKTGTYFYNRSDLDMLEYLTSQLRLKLKILGAARIYEEEQSDGM